MGGPGSGGHNAARRPTPIAVPQTRPIPWPWQDADPPWDRASIHAYLIDYCYEHGLCPPHSGDTIDALAHHHWQLEAAKQALERGSVEIHGQNALRLINASLAAIAADMRRLGVRPVAVASPPAASEKKRDFRPRLLT